MAATVEQFREGMRYLAGSVTILATATGDRERVGMTATAVCSVSGAPPTLLCCINRDNATRDAFAASDAFSVNILAAGDEDLANRFAMRLPHAERFKRGSWSAHETGTPVLDTAAAWFACKSTQTLEVGSHTVFFGEILEIKVRGSHVMPLLYAHGGYGKFAGAQLSLQDLMWSPNWQVYD